MRVRSIVLAALIALAILACDTTTHAVPACARSSGASKSGGGGGGGGGKNGGAAPAPRPTSAPARPTTPPPSPYRPPPPGAPTKPETNVRNQSRPTTPTPRNDAARDRARASARRPNIRPATEDYNDARATAPSRLSRGGAFTSPVTNIEYHYHDLGWYRRPGLVIDLYDPYDRFNYWYRPYSPFFGMQYMVAADCDGHEEQVEQPININVTVDQDGTVTGEVPATPVAPDSATTTVPGSVPAA